MDEGVAGDGDSKQIEGEGSTKALWFVISLIFAIFAINITKSAEIANLGFFWKTLAVVLGAPLGMWGASIGNAFRKFTKPDAIYTTGGAGSIFVTRIFWSVGPQLIGMFFGVIIAQVIVQKL